MLSSFKTIINSNHVISNLFNQKKKKVYIQCTNLLLLRGLQEVISKQPKIFFCED